jgi:thiamine monophosphate synthase
MTKAQEMLADKIELHLSVNSPGFHLSDDDMRLIAASLRAGELPQSLKQRAEMEARIQRALLDDEAFGVGCDNQDQLEAAASFSATFIANAILADTRPDHNSEGK